MPRQHSSRGQIKSAAFASIFAALGDETRLGLLLRLCDNGPLSIAGLTTGSDITRQAITKHLQVMEKAGLVGSRHQGRENVWQLEPHRLEQARRYLKQLSKRAERNA